MNKHIENALAKPFQKRWFDITYTDKWRELQCDREYAYNAQEARSQAEGHLAGTGYMSIDKVVAA